MTMEEVRQLSIKPPKKDFRHHTTWMPPISALKKVTELVNCQLDYLFSTWKHEAVLPNFLERGCLKKDEKGTVTYDFGIESRTENITNLLTEDENELQKKLLRCKKNKKREKSFAETRKRSEIQEEANDINSHVSIENKVLSVLIAVLMFYVPFNCISFTVG